MDYSALGRSRSQSQSVAGNDSFIDARQARSRDASSVYRAGSTSKRKDASLQSIQLSDTFSAPLAKKLRQLPKYTEVKHAIVKTPLPQDPIAQEALVTRELLLLLVGMESAYISFSQAYDPNILTERLAGPDFRYQRSIEASVRELAVAVAATAKHYMVVDAFTESQSQDRFGRVNQALCASLRTLLKDFRLAVAQLETAFERERDFSLHKLKTRLAPYADRLRHAYGVARAVMEANEQKAQESMGALRGSGLDDRLDDLKHRRGLDVAGAHAVSKHYVCKGGAVLRLLAQRRSYFAGDDAARALLDTLLRDASQPYLEMLDQWIHRGVIADPHREFLVEEAISARANPQVLPAFLDEYWQNKYRVHTDDLPPLLASRDVYDKVLQAGRYLNVIRECGGDDVSTDTYEAFESIEDPRIVLSVNRAYQHANTALLRLLVDTHRMVERLRSLKHYYFLDRADYFVNFVEMAGAELAKPASLASRTSLQYLLDMALRQPGSISAEDPYKEDAVVQLSPSSVIDKLMLVVQQEGVNPDLVEPRVEEDPAGEQYVRLHAPVRVPATTARDERRYLAIMALELHFNIPFPLSLFITPTCIIRYKFIFRYLVCLKHLERALCSAWVEHKKAAVWRHDTVDGPNAARIAAWKAAAARLRASMTTFVQHLLYYSTVEVLERNYRSFEASIGSSESVDHLIVEHGQFLYTCMTDMMITHLDLLTVQDKLFHDCRGFVSLAERASSWLGLVDPSSVPESHRDQSPPVRPRNRSTGNDYSDDELLTLLEQRLDALSDKFKRHMHSLIEAINDSASQESSIRLIVGARLEMLFGSHI